MSEHRVVMEVERVELVEPAHARVTLRACEWAYDPTRVEFVILRHDIGQWLAGQQFDFALTAAALPYVRP